MSLFKNGFAVDSAGRLVLYREKGTHWATCSCAFKNGFACGTMCALFGEPEHYTAQEWDADENEMMDVEYVKLELCHKTLICRAADFEDRRGDTDG